MLILSIQFVFFFFFTFNPHIIGNFMAKQLQTGKTICLNTDSHFGQTFVLQEQKILNVFTLLSTNYHVAAVFLKFNSFNEFTSLS